MEGYRTQEDIVQNLRDAGCDEDIISKFLECVEKGKKPESLRLLKRQRSELLDAVHKEQRKIDCLDYLVYMMHRQQPHKG